MCYTRYSTIMNPGKQVRKTSSSLADTLRGRLRRKRLGWGRTMLPPNHQRKQAFKAQHPQRPPRSFREGKEPPHPARQKEAGPRQPMRRGPSPRLVRPPGKPPSPHPRPGPAPSFPGLLPVGSAAPFASPTLWALPGRRSAAGHRLG